MENASKALIIAGAILLAILIISLGLVVYNQAKDTVGSVNLSQQEIEAFNSKFTSFEGDKVAGSQVNALIQMVISSNQQEINDSTGAYITIQFPSATLKTGGTDNRVVLMTVDSNKIKYYEADTAKFNNKDNLIKHEGVTLQESNTCLLKVTQGKTFKVEFAYSGGRIAAIYVH